MSTFLWKQPWEHTKYFHTLIFGFLTNLTITTNYISYNHPINYQGHTYFIAIILLQRWPGFPHVQFDVFKFSFCPRLCNIVAHELAVFGSHGDQNAELWLDRFPDFVTGAMASELAVHTS